MRPSTLAELADAAGIPVPEIRGYGSFTAFADTYLAACHLSGIDAAVDCWGGGVIVDDPAQLTPQRPVAPIVIQRATLSDGT